MKAQAFMLGYSHKTAAENKESPGIVTERSDLIEDNDAALDQATDGQNDAAVDAAGDKVVETPAKDKE